MSVWYERAVKLPCEKNREAAIQRQEQLTKPPGSLGRLEEVAIQFSAWQACVEPRLDQVDICVFAGDHGVVAEGVSAFPAAVTAQMIHNFTSGGAAIAVLAQHNNASFRVVNLGTAEALGPAAGLTNVQLAPGTANFCHEPAMTPEIVLEAMSAGAAQVDQSCQLFIGGEMGIGNTTSAAALASALLNLPAEQTVGRGTGVDDAGIAAKCSAVSRALSLHHSKPATPLETLRCLGGLEIAALVGAYIAAAQRGVPVLVDGYICTAAALLACRLNPGARSWMLFAHRSAEPGHRHLLEALSANPLLDFGMRLGEGSGAAVAIPLLRSACALQVNMATFAEAGVSDGA